jgi:hypothetical protein
MIRLFFSPRRRCPIVCPRPAALPLLSRSRGRATAPCRPNGKKVAIVWPASASIGHKTELGLWESGHERGKRHWRPDACLRPPSCGKPVDHRMEKLFAPSGWCGPVASQGRIPRRVRGGSEPFAPERFVRRGSLKINLVTNRLMRKRRFLFFVTIFSSTENLRLRRGNGCTPSRVLAARLFRVRRSNKRALRAPMLGASVYRPKCEIGMSGLL